MRFEGAPPPRRPIGLTPLIDVVFLLLMFFMLASTFTRFHEIPLASAGPAEARGTAAVPPLLVRLHEGGRVDVNGVGVDSAEIADYLLTLDVRFLQNAVVQVRAGATTQDVVDLLATLRRAGIGNTVVTR